MKRLKKISWHDTDNRDSALAIINNKVYLGEDHYECIDKFVKDSNFNYDDIDPDKVNERHYSYLNLNKNISLTCGHLDKKQKAIFIEPETIQNMTIDEAVNILKQQYPDYNVYDDDSCPTNMENNLNKYVKLSNI